MTEAELLELIRHVAVPEERQCSKQETTQPDTVTAENYARVVAEVMRRDGIELNGVDMRNIRTGTLEILARRRRSMQRRESAKNTHQWKKPERLRR